MLYLSLAPLVQQVFKITTLKRKQDTLLSAAVGRHVNMQCTVFGDLVLQFISFDLIGFIMFHFVSTLLQFRKFLEK